MTKTEYESLLKRIEKKMSNSYSKERNICDYISGMTDKYAIDKFNIIKK